MFKFLRSSSSRPVIELTVSNRTVVRVLLAVVITMLGLAALKQAQHALILIFISAFLALALNPPVHWISQHLPGKRRGNRSLATAISAMLLLLLLGSFLASVVPPIVRQSANLVDAVPRLVSDVRDQNSTVGRLVTRYDLQPQIDKFSGQLSERLKNASGEAVSTLSSLGSSIFSSLTVLALTFMMLIEGPHWIGWAKRLLPDDKEDDAEVLAGRMYRVVKGYVNGQVTLAALAAFLIMPMLFILHVGYPFALMFVIFICGLIPMIGHTIGAIIVTTVALFHSPVAAAIILVYYFLYQQIENYFVQPKIQANSTDMSPLLVFISVVVGVSFSGLLGGLVAIPVMGCIRVGVLYWLENREPAVATKS